MADYRRGSHAVHDIKYHFVWVTKYRHPILQGDVGQAARSLIRRICEERDALIVKGHVSRDHVHVLVSTPPNVAPSDLVQAVKGKSARLLFEEFPSLRKRYWGQHLWARGYFCASVGTVTDEMIAEYIAHQDKPREEGFTVWDDGQ